MSRGAAPKKEKKEKDKNHPEYGVSAYLQKIHGVGAVAIFEPGETGGLELLAETSTDLSKWKDEKHYKLESTPVDVK